MIPGVADTNPGVATCGPQLPESSISARPTDTKAIRNQRSAKDFEGTVDSARAFLYAASVMLLLRRIARAS